MITHAKKNIITLNKFFLVTYRYCVKAKKFGKISHYFLKLLTQSLQSGRFFQIFVALNRYLNFMKEILFPLLFFDLMPPVITIKLLGMIQIKLNLAGNSISMKIVTLRHCPPSLVCQDQLGPGGITFSGCPPYDSCCCSKRHLWIRSC